MIYGVFSSCIFCINVDFDEMLLLVILEKLLWHNTIKCMHGDIKSSQSICWSNLILCTLITDIEVWCCKKSFRPDYFLYPPRVSGGGLWYHVGCPCVRSSVRLSYVRPSAFSLPDDNLSKCKWISTKLGMCIDILEIWFGIANGFGFCFLSC